MLTEVIRKNVLGLWLPGQMYLNATLLMKYYWGCNNSLCANSAKLMVLWLKQALVLFCQHSLLSLINAAVPIILLSAFLFPCPCFIFTFIFLKYSMN